MSGGKEGNSIKISMTLTQAVRAAGMVRSYLEDKEIESIICGSVRRGKTGDIGDIDMVVAPTVETAVREVEKWAEEVRHVKFTLHTKNLDSRSKMAAFTVQAIPFNFYAATQEQWGAMVLFLTGSQLFNIVMRGEAKKQGYKLNQYGLWLGDDQIAGKTEEQMFEALGLEYVKPEDRSLDNSNKRSFRPLRMMA